MILSSWLWKDLRVEQLAVRSKETPHGMHILYFRATGGGCETSLFFLIFCIMYVNTWYFYLSWSLPSIYILCLAVCLFVCLYPINVKTNELIRSKFCVGPHMTPQKVYGCSKLQNFFEFCKILKMREKYYEIREMFCFCFILQKEKMLSR